MDFDYEIERIIDILNALIDDYFRLGQMPIENAFFVTILAREIASKLAGHTCQDELFSALQSHPDFMPIFIPGDDSVNNHSEGLKKLQRTLAGTTDNRETVVFVRKDRRGDTRGSTKKHYQYLYLKQ